MLKFGRSDGDAAILPGRGETGMKRMNPA